VRGAVKTVNGFPLFHVLLPAPINRPLRCGRAFRTMIALIIRSHGFPIEPSSCSIGSDDYLRFTDDNADAVLTTKYVDFRLVCSVINSRSIS
jgi:hypothetical protein